jgi:hypothetical protein
MKVQKNTLLGAMKHCLPGVEKGNSLIEGADTFVFGHDAIHSYNDGVSVSASFPTEELSGAVKSLDFFKLINKLPAEEIEIIATDGKWEIKTGKIEAEITLVNSKISEYISQLNVNGLEWAPLPTDFFEAVRLSKIGCNHSINRGIYVNEKTVMSTDTIRINHYNLSVAMPIFWLDDPAVTELMKLDNIIDYCVQPAWVHFRNSTGVIFSCKRKADNQYPFQPLTGHVNNHVKKDEDVIYKLPPNLNEVVDRVSVMSNTIREQAAVKMIINRTNITIQSSRSSGRIKEVIEFPEPLENFPDDRNVDMWVEPSFLIEAAKKVTGFFIREYSTGKGVQKNLVFFNDKYTQIVATFVSKG